MAQLDPVIFREISVIEKVIADEVWFEGERRGCPVSAEDPVVQEKVCQIILRIGSELRAKILAQLALQSAPGMQPANEYRQEHAA